MTARICPTLPPASPALATGRGLVCSPVEAYADFRARVPRRAAGVAAHHRRARWARGQHAMLRLVGGRALTLLATIAVLSLFYGPQSHGNPVRALLSGAAALAAPDSDAAVETGVVPMPFERTGETFPGSAYYYLAPDDAAPPAAAFAQAPFAIDPTAPPLDPAAHSDDQDPTVSSGAGPAARALAVGNAGDYARALSCLTSAIYYEAATEPDAGQRAVAQVVLNRVAHPSFPKTVCGVVFQGSERYTGCQFTFTCDGSLARRPDAMFWARAQAVARAALGGSVYAPVGLATNYHTFAVHPSWDAQLDFVGQIGAHRFYRMVGPAGAAQAFHFAYGGREPLPGPHPRSARALYTTPSADPLVFERAYAAALARAKAAGQNGLGGSLNAAPESAAPQQAVAPAPAYTQQALREGGDAAFRASNLPQAGASPVLEQSGRWIGTPQ